MLWGTVYEHRERFVLAVPRAQLHTLEVTLIVSILEFYGRTHLVAFGVKQAAFVCIWVDSLVGMWIHTDIWV